MLHGDVVVKSDQEPAIEILVEDLGKYKAGEGSGRFVVEKTAVGASQANGMVERAIRSVRNQAKVLLSAVCARWGIENIEVSHPMVAYAVEYGAILLNRFEVGKDGRTNYERCKGKKATTLGMEFGEAIYWRRKKIGGGIGEDDEFVG